MIANSLWKIKFDIIIKEKVAQNGVRTELVTVTSLTRILDISHSTVITKPTRRYPGDDFDRPSLILHIRPWRIIADDVTC